MHHGMQTPTPVKQLQPVLPAHAVPCGHWLLLVQGWTWLQYELQAQNVMFFPTCDTQTQLGLLVHWANPLQLLIWPWQR